MSHDITLNINVEEVMNSQPIQKPVGFSALCWLMISVGTLAFLFALFFGYTPELAWSAYYINLCFFMGLACGGVIIAAIFQIVRAKWSPPVRRIAEANVAFLPVAWFLLILTWFGKEYLFSWAKAPMPGREWWMQPGFVYTRFAVLLAFLFLMMYRFVRFSLRSDIGTLRERSASRSKWSDWIYQDLARNWRGADSEIKEIQRKLSFNAPLLVVLYVVIYSLFIFEMVMGMNSEWTSNLFGAFEFIGNIYVGWAVLSLYVMRLSEQDKVFAKAIQGRQLWDLGMLALGFCMMWGYMFFSQFLCQWYGNLPEETHWMIVRTRIPPWWGMGWFTFAMCFVIPFILLLSEDIKRVPKAFRVVCSIIFIGIWFEKFMIIMPEITPTRIPSTLTEIIFQILLFLGFLGAYLLSLRTFIAKFPFIPFSHPLTKGSRDW